MWIVGIGKSMFIYTKICTIYFVIILLYKVDTCNCVYINHIYRENEFTLYLCIYVYISLPTNSGITNSLQVHTFYCYYLYILKWLYHKDKYTSSLRLCGANQVMQEGPSYI